ncbi:hypothetical protein PYW07_000684 [Mythimna separata]|uniref:Uncharacterized protein n=1 Tax=Mythimna separata TaxID=271217 RepID=A0AAD7YS05_MYTSE|nr:hypothetical protein PYW07_000684 [Mythimna separata]
MSRAALVVLAALAHRAALADQLCDTMQYGNETNMVLNRGVLRVEPGSFTLEISEPQICSELYGQKAVGLKVTACDEGQAPRVMLLDAAHGVVVRAASPAHTAFVYVTMYCSAPRSDGDADPDPAPTTDSAPDSEGGAPVFETRLAAPFDYMPDTSSAPKRPKDKRPNQLANVLGDPTPKWQQLPEKRPYSPFLNLRSLLDKETRRSVSRVLNRRFADYNAYDDPLSLHWTDEPTVSNSYYPPESESPHTDSFSYEGSHPSVGHNRQSKSAIKHDSKKQTRYVPPIHEEDPALLLQWKKDNQQAPLPKLLLLLQDQEYPAPAQTKCSEHSAEEAEPWWPDPATNNDIVEGEMPPDYTTDYTADDSDAFSYIQAEEPSPHHAPEYNPPPLTERPPPRVHNSLSWIKTSNAAPHKSPMKMKHTGTTQRHEVLHDRTWAVYPENYYPSKPNLPQGPAYLPNPMPEPYYPSESYGPPARPYQPAPYYSEPDYHSMPYIPPAHHAPPKHHYPARPHQLSKPHYPQESHYVSEAHAHSKSHVYAKPHRALKAKGAAEQSESSSPWNFLSELLLSHPTFRDSTHVIRIR